MCQVRLVLQGHQVADAGAQGERSAGVVQPLRQQLREPPTAMAQVEGLEVVVAGEECIAADDLVSGALSCPGRLVLWLHLAFFAPSLRTFLAHPSSLASSMVRLVLSTSAGQACRPSAQHHRRQLVLSPLPLLFARRPCPPTVSKLSFQLPMNICSVPMAPPGRTRRLVFMAVWPSSANEHTAHGTGRVVSEPASYHEFCLAYSDAAPRGLGSHHPAPTPHRSYKHRPVA